MASKLNLELPRPLGSNEDTVTIAAHGEGKIHLLKFDSRRQANFTPHQFPRLS